MSGSLVIRRKNIISNNVLLKNRNFLFTKTYVVFILLVGVFNGRNNNSTVVLVEAFKDNLISALLHQVPDFKPRGILDIGANSGKYSQFVHRMYPDASIFLIEADDMHQYKLSKFVNKTDGEKKNITYTIAVLSSTDNEKVPWYGNGDTGNSMFRERSELFEGTTPTSKTSITLDTLLRKHKDWDHHNVVVDLIKIDVQGAELVVLKGATEALKSATFLQLEASTVVYNDGGSCTWQVDAFLRSMGYALYELGDKMYYYPRYKTRGVGQYDIIYINTNHLPETIKNASFCGGIDYDNDDEEDYEPSSFYETSLMELGDMIGVDTLTTTTNTPLSSSTDKKIGTNTPATQQTRRRHRKKGGGILLFLFGIIIGYLMCYFQIQGGFFFRKRWFARED